MGYDWSSRMMCTIPLWTMQRCKPFCTLFIAVNIRLTMSCGNGTMPFLYAYLLVTENLLIVSFEQECQSGPFMKLSRQVQISPHVAMSLFPKLNAFITRYPKRT